MSSLFKLNHWRVLVSQDEDNPAISRALVKLTVNGKSKQGAAEGVGPIDALSKSFSEALQEFYPQVSNILLENYMAHIETGDSTVAKVTVEVEMSLSGKVVFSRNTSDNLVKASWDALVDCYNQLLTYPAA